MLGVKSTSSNLTEAFAGLYSKEGRREEEILLLGVEILLFDRSLLEKYNLTFPLSCLLHDRIPKEFFSGIMVEECSSLDWNRKVFPFGDVS